ncbi:hypothetical protein CDEST_00508 [Colletotrichum destructivum]|uniref:Uncharacterized protein n=1 Tax=Colletotrichum destructivum TaxID=34406 RepID=A0AAX4HX68_9PEZI|nr:hypothetical protein CDEST_00508 [Colletotrichum destructivum]
MARERLSKPRRTPKEIYAHSPWNTLNLSKEHPETWTGPLLLHPDAPIGPATPTWPTNTVGEETATKAKEREKHETNASGARAASSSTPYAKTDDCKFKPGPIFDFCLFPTTRPANHAPWSCIPSSPVRIDPPGWPAAPGTVPPKSRSLLSRFSPFALAINTHPCLRPNLAIVRTISFVFGQLGVPVVIVLVVQGRSVDLRGPNAACRPRSPLSIEPYLVLLPDLSCQHPA